MAWFKVDDTFHSSRKLMSIPARQRMAAIGLWTVAGSWSASELTDGVIPKYMLKAWGATEKAAQSLVDAGLWRDEQATFVFYSWLEYQPSKAQVKAERDASKARMQEIRARRKQAKPQKQADSGELFGRTVPNGYESVRNPDPTRPDPTIYKNTIDQSQAIDRVRIERFEEFWKAYPRKVGKQKAQTKYATQAKKHGEQTIIDGAHRLAADPNLPEPNYIPHPTTWLERGGWNDEPLPARNDTYESPMARNARSIQQRHHQPNLEPWLQLEGGHQ